MGSKGKLGFLLAALLLAAAGCGQGGESPKAEVDISPIQPESSDAQGNDGIVIGSITMSSDGEWFGEVLAGVRSAAKDLGVTLVEEDSKGDVAKEKELIEGMVQDGVSAIAICPITQDVSGESLMEAEEAGIPAVTWNTTVDSDVTAAVCVDPEALGGDTGDYLAEYIHTNNLSGIRIGMVTNESYSIGVARCTGFRESIKDLEKDGSVTVVCEAPAETTEETTPVVEKMLADYPDLDMIWCWNQTSLLECINVVKEAGNRDITIMGTDMSVGIAQDMLNGSVNILAVTTQLPYNMGYKAVVNAVRAAKGEEVEETIVIPTFTYTNSDKDGLEQYIKSHEAFAQ